MSGLFLECKIVTHDPSQDELLGKSDFYWTECVIKRDRITYIREYRDCSDEECEFNGNATIHFDAGDYCITDQPYKKIVNWWTE